MSGLVENLLQSKNTACIWNDIVVRKSILVLPDTRPNAIQPTYSLLNHDRVSELFCCGRQNRKITTCAYVILYIRGSQTV